MSTARRGLYALVRELRDAAREMLAYAADGLLQSGALAIDAVPEKFKTTAVLYWRRLGITFTKAATTALVFTAAHVITANKYGIVLVQITDAGVFSTKVPGATQAYNTAALALAAKPAPDAGNIEVGYIAIANNAGDWTANTDDLTAASDVTTATFVNAAVKTAPTATF